MKSKTGFCADCLTYCDGCDHGKYTGCTMKITAKSLRDLIYRYRKEKETSDSLDRQWSTQPENHFLEERADQAYESMMYVYRCIVDDLARITNLSRAEAKTLFDSRGGDVEDLLKHVL